MDDLVRRLRTACSPESPLGKLCSEAADALERYHNFDTRRLAKIELGWDECGACGQDHRLQEQADGVYYCEYCGIEALPETVVEIKGLLKHG